MLKTVRMSVNDAANMPSFDSFYMNYVMSVQDMNIDAEVSRLRRLSRISYKSINRINIEIDSIYSEVTSGDFSNAIPKCV